MKGNHFTPDISNLTEYAKKIRIIKLKKGIMGFKFKF